MPARRLVAGLATTTLVIGLVSVGLGVDPLPLAGSAAGTTAGGVLNFGGAGSFGSLQGTDLAAPVVGMAPTPDGGGYWLVASDGGVFTFGDAVFGGSAAGSPLAQPVVGITPVPHGAGYWLVEGRRAPLTGKVVVIDPGHNGGNGADPAFINAPVFNGRTAEACDTTGAATDSGYSEALFNFNVATDLAADLRAQGATVILTRTTNTGVGPCITQRAAIGNDAHADVALSIHADGGPPGGRGFAILEPVADGPNDAVIGSSAAFGTDLRDSFLAGTGEPVSNYDGVDGIQPRGDLGGINLTTVPKVFIECANMRNASDAALIVSPGWQGRAAAAIDAGISAFLLAR
ncbi:MAG TPA: N-acetylmuramoyl-L-alanine amidase [Acidimicrobiales bacterium]|nr:N-acetylmuramoyl-L-alanine amidase [Acidimicrobiales bacterium]